MNKRNTVKQKTLIVVAKDSKENDRREADFVCDGMDDQVQIQAAIDSLPSGGVLPGKMNFCHVDKWRRIKREK